MSYLDASRDRNGLLPTLLDPKGRGDGEMRFGILKHVGFSREGEEHNRIISAGDALECLAIRNVYRSMGIDENELVGCYPYELGQYYGEYCVLPINVYALSLDYSRRIIPCFLGLTLGGVTVFQSMILTSCDGLLRLDAETNARCACFLTLGLMRIYKDVL